MKLFNSTKSILPHKDKSTFSSECNTSQTIQEIKSLSYFLEAFDKEHDVLNIIVSFINLTEYNNLALINRHWHALINQIIIPEKIYQTFANFPATLPHINQQKNSLIPVLSNRTSKDTLQGHTFKELKNRIEEINQSQVSLKNEYEQMWLLSRNQFNARSPLDVLATSLIFVSLGFLIYSLSLFLLTASIMLITGATASLAAILILTITGLAASAITATLGIGGIALTHIVKSLSEINTKTSLRLQNDYKNNQSTLITIKQTIHPNFFSPTTEKNKKNHPILIENNEATSSTTILNVL